MRARVFTCILTALALTLMVNLCFAQDTITLWDGVNYLACVNYNDGPTSSDMTLVVQLEVDGQIVVNEGDPVKYVFMRSADQALGESLGMDWVQPAFDDSDWEDGISGVGYSDGDENTEITRENEAGERDCIAIYTRYAFSLDALPSIGTVILRADYDDGYAAWVNGVEIARSPNLEGRDLTWNASADGIDNHGSTELAAGTPNPDRQYQEETAADFSRVAAAALKPTGKLAATWGMLKQR